MFVKCEFNDLNVKKKYVSKTDTKTIRGGGGHPANFLHMEQR